jgi:hypothetical protein
MDVCVVVVALRKKTRRRTRHFSSGAMTVKPLCSFTPNKTHNIIYSRNNQKIQSQQ